LYFPEYTGFIFWDNGKVAFYCNNGKYETELMRECSPYYVSKVMPPVSKQSINEAVRKYLKTDEEMFLFVYSVCGLISSFLIKLIALWNKFL
jgi:hypothetical protein